MISDPKVFWLLGTLALAAIWFFPAGCAGDDDDDDGSGDSGDDDDTGPSVDGVDCEDDNCFVTGVILEDLTMTADKNWILRGGVFIGNDVDPVVLTIEPGTQVFGETSTKGMLVITRGAKIMAEGTADAPIVFSSSKYEGERARGDWGGIIINGRAPVNNCLGDEIEYCESLGEGATGEFGGSDPEDDSGIMRYVRVEFAGRLVSPENELNGIAFQGVGSGGVFEYIQVHMNKDDGIEFFGGTANIGHVVVTGAADDGFDWTDGWTGKAQFVVIQQYAGGGDQGIEADNNAENNVATPRSRPTLSNFTIVGQGDDFSDFGILLREGTGGNLHNMLVWGWDEAALSIMHRETYRAAWDEDAAALTGVMILTDSIIWNNNSDFAEDEIEEPFSVVAFFNALNDGNSEVDPALGDPRNQTDPDFAPAEGSPALSGGNTPSDPFFDEVSFIGAIGADDWTKGWTTTAEN
ncbi:MAG: hypothetical protein IT350_16900 [Deltaproteobacteria bacterium]|nr:hypothetical protein [Deltaproteobacteria bacterium]